MIPTSLSAGISRFVSTLTKSAASPRRRRARLVRIETLEPRIVLSMPGVNNLHLVSDTGSSATDKITTNVTLAGSVATNGEWITVEFDTNGDGASDGSTFVDMSGNFQYLPMVTMPGATTAVRARTVKMDMMMMTMQYGSWSDDFTFTLNMPPMANSGSAKVLENAPKTVTLSGTDMGSSDTLTAQLVAQPSHGTASLSGNSLTYTPSENFTGSDTMRFVMKDSAGEASGAVDYTFTVSGISIQLTEGESILIADEGSSADELLVRELIAYTVMVTPPLDVDVTSAVVFLQTTGPLKLYSDAGRLNELDPAHGYSIDPTSPNRLPTVVYAVADDVGLCQLQAVPKIFGKFAGPPTLKQFETAKVLATLDDLAGKGMKKGIQEGFKSAFAEPFRPVMHDLDLEIDAANSVEDVVTAMKLTAVKSKLEALIEKSALGLGDKFTDDLALKIKLLERQDRLLAQQIAEQLSRGPATVVPDDSPDVGYRLSYSAKLDQRQPVQQLYQTLKTEEFRDKIFRDDVNDLQWAALGIGTFLDGIHLSLNLSEGNTRISELKIYARLNNTGNMFRDLGDGHFDIDRTVVEGMSLNAKTHWLDIEGSVERNDGLIWGKLRGVITFPR